MDEFFSILAKWLATCCSPTPPPPPPPPDLADDGQLNVKTLVDGQVYCLREPADGMEVKVDIVFFHGLQLFSYKKACLETWQVSTGGKEGEEKKIICWPQVWLGSDFPDARVLSVSYDSRAVGRGTETTRDIAKALLKSLVELEGVGHNTPVILVGHSLGGLVIKLMCKEAGQLQNADGGGKYFEFMENLLGVFFYATPHGGTALAREVCRKLGSVVHLAPALKFLAKENYDLLELTEDFNEQRRRWKWKTWALVEVQRIPLGPLAGVLVVPSDSARFDILDKYTSVKDADHFSICKPPSKTHESYKWIQEFVNTLLQEDEHAHIDRPYQAVRALLKGHNRAKQALEYIDRSAKQGANNVRRLLDAGVMSPLLRELESPNPSNVDIRIAACWALDALAYDISQGLGTSKEAMQAAEEGGASIPSLLQMLSDDKTVYAAIYCLRVLTGNAGNRTRLMDRMEAKGILQSLYISPPTSIESPKSVSRAAKEILDVMNWASELESYEKFPTKPVSIFVNYNAPKSSS